MQLDLKRLFSACAGCIGFAVLTPASSQAGTPDTELWRDLNRSAFSTTSILSGLAHIDKQVRAAQIAPLPGNSALVSSQPGAFNMIRRLVKRAQLTSSAKRFVLPNCSKRRGLRKLPSTPSGTPGFGPILP